MHDVPFKENSRGSYSTAIVQISSAGVKPTELDVAEGCAAVPPDVRKVSDVSDLPID
jgi:hypothetical protein